jgi:hypothetical protein
MSAPDKVPTKKAPNNGAFEVILNISVVTTGASTFTTTAAATVAIFIIIFIVIIVAHWAAMFMVTTSTPVAVAIITATAFVAMACVPVARGIVNLNFDVMPAAMTRRCVSGCSEAAEAEHCDARQDDESFAYHGILRCVCPWTHNAIFNMNAA